LISPKCSAKTPHNGEMRSLRDEEGEESIEMHIELTGEW